MELNVAEIEAKMQVLAMNFSNTFFKSVGYKYKFTFENSDVADEMEALHTIYTLLLNRRHTTIIQRDIKLIDSIVDSYTFLITVYKQISNVSILSPNFKRYHMVKYLQDWCTDERVNKVKVNQTDPEIMGRLTTIVDHISPTKENMTQDEVIRAKAKAEIAKMLLKK